MPCLLFLCMLLSMCHFGLGCTLEIQGLAMLSRLCCDITAWRRLLALKDKHMANSISTLGGGRTVE